MNNIILTNELKEKLIETGIRLGELESAIGRLVYEYWEWDYEDLENNILSNEDILCKYLTECICLWGDIDGK